MKPNAALKSSKVKVRLMASRPFTSLQPASLASAVRRALPVNFSPMVGSSQPRIVPRIACRLPLAKAVRTPTLSMRAGRLPGMTATVPEAFMSWSFNIGRIAGTAILVHVTFVLFLGWIFVASWVAGGPESAWQALAFLLLLFACVVAHEFGHIFTARAFGVTTPDVVLLPIGGVARLERIPEEPWQEFLIAIA